MTAYSLLQLQVFSEETWSQQVNNYDTKLILMMWLLCFLKSLLNSIRRMYSLVWKGQRKVICDVYVEEQLWALKVALEISTPVSQN